MGQLPDRTFSLSSFMASLFPPQAPAAETEASQPSPTTDLFTGLTLQQSLQVLRESEARYRSLVIATSQMVWNTAASGQVTTAMPSWTAYTGQTEAEIQGWGWLEAVHPEDQEQTVQVWQQALATSNLYEVEYRLRRFDGVYRYFWVRGVPVLDQNGTIREWVGVCFDISNRKQTEASLQHRAEELTRTTTILAQTATILEKRNQELDQFAYVVSHDLKAPLRAIANLSQWLEEDLADRLDDATRRQMDLLRGRVHRMEALIDGLLQYSRIGRAQANPEWVNVATLLEEIIDSLSPPAPFRVTIAPDLPSLKTERLHLQQVFANLISNGIKHHDRADGHVHIGGRQTATGYEFFVQDDGPGIAPEYHSRIFGIFQTLEARDKVESTGIGLSLVKKIVEHRGGTIHLASQPVQGATFTFTWPATLL